MRAIENRAQTCVRDAVRSGRLERTLTCRENLNAAAAVSHGGSRIAGDLILFCLLSPDFLLCVGVALTLTLTSHTLAPAFWAVPLTPAPRLSCPPLSLLCPTPGLGCGHALPAPLLRASALDTSPRDGSEASVAPPPAPRRSGRRLH